MFDLSPPFLTKFFPNHSLIFIKIQKIAKLWEKTWQQGKKAYNVEKMKGGEKKCYWIYIDFIISARTFWLPFQIAIAKVVF